MSEARGLAMLSVFHNRQKQGHEHERPYFRCFGLDSFRVADVVRVADRVVQVVVETVDQQGICPGRGVASSRVKERPPVRVRTDASITADSQNRPAYPDPTKEQGATGTDATFVV